MYLKIGFLTYSISEKSTVFEREIQMKDLLLLFSCQWEFESSNAGCLLKFVSIKIYVTESFSQKFVPQIVLVGGGYIRLELDFYQKNTKEMGGTTVDTT